MLTELGASVEEVAATAEKNAAVNDANAASSEQLARAAHQVARSAEQISSLSAGSATASGQAESAARRIVDIVSSARRTADEVTRTTREGGVVVNRSIAGLTGLRQAMQESSTVIREMGKRSEEIGAIVQTINLSAERTNLLSLNASSDAARSGEHGRGGAVVAEEIRALSDRAAAAV